MIPSYMRAAVIQTGGGPNEIQILERPVPSPKEEEILVRVAGSALNRADLIQRMGAYPAPPDAPADIPGLEYSGEVVSMGTSVNAFSLGDKVFGLVPGGAHAEYLVVHAQTAMRIPSSLDTLVAGTIPEAFMTAWDALSQANFRAGKTVLINAVGSGIGLAATQLVRALGGKSIGLSRTREKLVAASKLGLDIGLLPEFGTNSSPAFAKQVSEKTKGRGVDIVLDLVGGGWTSEAVLCMANKGRLILIGLLAGPQAELDLRRILSRRIHIIGTVMRSRSLQERISTTESFVSSVYPLLEMGELISPIHNRYTLDNISAAHTELESNNTTGKIAITIAT